MSSAGGHPFVNQSVGCHAYRIVRPFGPQRSGAEAIINDRSIVAVLLFLAALAAGCTTASFSTDCGRPADPDAPVRAVRYSPVLAGYSSQRPVAPMPWRERNERVTPKGEAQ